MFEHSIYVYHRAGRYWRSRFDPISAAVIQKKRTRPLAFYLNWRWHMDEMFMKIGWKTRYLW